MVYPDYKTCPKGHEYMANVFPECPTCANEKQAECNLAVQAAMGVMEEKCGEPIEYQCNECKQLFLNVIPDEHGTYSRIAGSNSFMRCGGKVEKVKP